MFKTLLLLLLAGTPLYAARARVEMCTGAYGDERRSDYIKQYLYLNLAFPMHPGTIHAGLSAFVIAHGLPAETFSTRISDEEWSEAQTAMERAHAAAGIDRRVSLKTLKEVIEPIHLNVPLLVENAAKEPNAFLYATTILAALKSRVAREISDRYRESLSGKLTFAERRKMGASFGVEMSHQIKIALMTEHPELAEPVVRLHGHRLAQTLLKSHLIYRSFADPGF